MKSKIILAALALALTVVVCFAQKKEEPKEKLPTLIAAYGTSYSETSSNAVSLLDPASKGYWQPQSQDFGVNEGVYFQFLEPILINFIEVIVEGDVKDKLTLQPSLNGQTQTRKSKTKTKEVLIKDGDGNVQEISSEPIDTEFYDITADDKMENGNTVFTIKENKTNYLNYTAKSIFLKIKDAKTLPKIKSIRIFGKDTNTPLAINIPLTPKASVTASSVLTPATAYSPENLFDSQLDMAWSTEGKETDGINQSVTITFDSKEEIGGIIIWNGYQRSETHFKANGRVKKLDINGQIVQVNDAQGLQTILLPNKIKTDKITLTIKEIFKGSKYKDVLMSELRFITPEGQIILPQVKRTAAELSKSDVFKTDVTYINLIEMGVIWNGQDSEDISVSKDTLRIRSNGSFVLHREGRNESAGISEGNWEETGKNKIRIFGKKYRIIPSITNVYSYSGYVERADDPNVKPTAVVIFQSDVTFSKFNSLTKKEQENIVKFILGNYLPDEVFIRAKTQEKFGTYKYLYGERHDDDVDYDERPNDDDERRESLAKAAMLEDILTELEKINPICIKSDVYTGLMISYDESR
ncbi:MAG: hypothetical protein FWH43_04030 [Endomicrobia bacterium]|nr:hypothetical protein [Endomicrobiia bacterium]